MGPHHIPEVVLLGCFLLSIEAFQNVPCGLQCECRLPSVDGGAARRSNTQDENNHPFDRDSH